jgi:hypothetical protein
VKMWEQGLSGECDVEYDVTVQSADSVGRGKEIFRAYGSVLLRKRAHVITDQRGGALGEWRYAKGQVTHF